MNPAALPVPCEAVRDAFRGQIPSETTSGERRLLFDLFSSPWDGLGHVVEIAPFLGGTTRAIAWGMAHNPRLAPDALLHTYDRFAAYYSAEQLRQTVEPLVRSGGLAARQADELCRTADFERLFAAYADMIHGCLKSPTYLPGGRQIFWKEAALTG